MARKGPKPSLTDEQVRQMRARYASGLASQTALAAEYGVTQAQVSRIVTHKQYTHVQ